MGKYLKLFSQDAEYQQFKDSEEYILPNVSFVENNNIVYYNPYEEKPSIILARYNATEDNLIAFNGAQNMKAMKVNGTPIEFEPVKNDINTFDVLGENISLDMETFPESYVIKSPVSSWSFKAKDPNYTINENTYACALMMMDGMTMIQPMPIAEVMNNSFTTNDGVTLEAVDSFLAEMNMQFQYGIRVGFTLCDLDVNSETYVFIDTEHQTNVTTGGLPTYSFDSEGLYDVEIELSNPVISMHFANTPLINIEIGDGITSIEYRAFFNCKGLTSLHIGSGVTSIGNYAFRGCSGLTSIVVSEGNTVYDSRENCNCIIETATNTLIQGCNNSVIPNSVTSIGNYAFDGCSGLTSVVIPDSVTSIGENAFYSCSSLNEVPIGSGVTSIGEMAFGYCSSLTSVVIPDSVTSIGSRAFEECDNLTDVHIGSGVTTIGQQAFAYCSGLTSVVIPDSVTTIGEYAFYACKGLTSIVIPDSVTSIGERAFAYCYNLTSIDIPDSVTSIGNNAFYSCSGLTSVHIGSGVTSIGDLAFDSCYGLNEITCNAITAPSISSSTFQIVKQGGVLKVPEGSDYSSWMSRSGFYLGYYNWTIQYF